MTRRKKSPGHLAPVSVPKTAKVEAAEKEQAKAIGTIQQAYWRGYIDGLKEK